MAAQRGPYILTESALIGEVAARVGNGFSKSDVSAVVKALKAEMIECIQLGHKVSLAGLVILTPVAKSGRKKGTVVRNPFDGSTKTLKTDEPDKFAVKARVSPAVKNGFPTARTKEGQALLKQLAPVKRAAPKAAPAAKPTAKGKGRK